MPMATWFGHTQERSQEGKGRGPAGKQEAKDKAAAEKAEKKRLAACAKRGIPDAECAPSEQVALTVGTSEAG